MLFALCLTILSSETDASPQPLIFTHTFEKKIPLGKHLSIFEDKDGHATIADMLRPESALNFFPSKDLVPNFGFTQSTFWCRFTIENASPLSLSLILESNWAHHDIIDFYVVHEGRVVSHEKEGDQFPYYSRQNKYPNVTFPIRIDGYAVQTIYFRVRSKASMIIDFVLWQPDAFTTNAIQKHYMFGLYYGAVIVMILYNLFIFVGVQEKIHYLYYVLFISSLLLIQMTLDGFAYTYLWPAYPGWASKCVNIFVFMGIFWGTLFSQKFLDTRIHVPKFDILLRLVTSLSFVGIWTMFFIDISLAGEIATTAGLIFPLIIFTASLLCLVRRVREARYFFWASLCLLVGMVLVALDYCGIVHRGFLSTFALHIGTTVQALLLSFGLADRINALKREHCLVQEANLTMEKQFSDKLQMEIDLKTLSLNQQKIQLEQANRELKEIDVMKSNFFANISHELRTPLTLICGWTEYIMAGELGTVPDPLKDIIHKINSQNLLLTEKINNMLKLSKFDAGMLKLKLNRIDIEAFVRRIVYTFQDLTAHSGISLECCCEAPIAPIFLDREKLRDILNNLIRNAYKFTESGSITVTLTKTKHHIRISVADTGVGIPLEIQKTIFNRFEQGRNSRTRPYEGTGLGLAIVKESVDIMKGTITVESLEHHGTVFHVHLPNALEQLASDAFIERRRKDRRVDTTDMPGIKERRKNVRRENDLAEIDDENTFQIIVSKSAADDTDKLKIVNAQNAQGTLVIAEDDLGVRDLFQDVLKEYTLIIAANGQLAWEAIQKHQPDLVISDIMMPVMDGYSLVKAIKASKHTENIPIILITAAVDKNDRIKGLQLGADDFLTKPFHHMELKTRVKNVISLRKLYRERLRSEQLEIFLMVLASAIESKDKYTGGHVERVANYAADLARKMKLPDEKVNEIYLGTIVHDIGKIGIRDDVLNKQSKLADEEFEHIKRHPVIGKKLLSQLEIAPVAVNIAYGHQEKWDGTGYPQGINGRQIPIEARISTVADFWDAITSDRPYRKAMPITTAMEIMKKERGKAFDPDILDIFMDDQDKLYLKHLAGNKLEAYRKVS